jgi:hypothetical protein
MSDMPDNLCGCTIDPRETELVCESLGNAGCNPILAEARPSLRGAWERNGRKPVFLTDADDVLAWKQNSGTCCGQGWGLALQTAINWSIKFGSRLGRFPIRIAWEPLYVLGRRVIGRDSLGRGAGACVPWLAQAGHDIGLLVRGLYRKLNLSRDQEAWAVEMSQPGAPPLSSELLQAMANFKLQAAMKVDDIDLAADALSAGYPLVRGADRATGARRDANGISGTVKCGGHCEHIPIVFMGRDGNRYWGERQSWRGTPSQPQGGGPFKLSDGSERPVPDGVGGIRDSDVQYYIDQGDLWTAEPPLQLWADPDLQPSDLAALA